jgi:hypothetical protein
MIVEPATPERKDGGRSGRLSLEGKYHLREVQPCRYPSLRFQRACSYLVTGNESLVLLTGY